MGSLPDGWVLASTSSATPTPIATYVKCIDTLSQPWGNLPLNSLWACNLHCHAGGYLYYLSECAGYAGGNIECSCTNDLQPCAHDARYCGNDGGTSLNPPNWCARRGGPCKHPTGIDGPGQWLGGAHRAAVYYVEVPSPPAMPLPPTSPAPCSLRRHCTHRHYLHYLCLRHPPAPHQPDAPIPIHAVGTLAAHMAGCG